MVSNKKLNFHPNLFYPSSKKSSVVAIENVWPTVFFTLFSCFTWKFIMKKLFVWNSLFVFSFGSGLFLSNL